MSLHVETPLQSWDFLVIGLYFASMLLTGLFMAKFVRSSGDFFSGGKRVPGMYGRWRGQRIILPLVPGIMRTNW